MRSGRRGPTWDQGAKQDKSVCGGITPIAALRIQLAEGFLARLWGLHALQWRQSPPPSPPSAAIVPALLLRPCRAVHTFGLREPIDVIFLGTQNRILRCVPRLAPNRVAFHWRARAVLELPAGYCTGSSWPSALSRALFDSKIIT